MQLASHQWHHCCLAVLEAQGVAWKGSWDLKPFYQAPDTYFLLKIHSLSNIGKGSYGSVH